MGRATAGLVDAIGGLPWPMGVIFGVGGFLAVRFGLPVALQGDLFAPAIQPIANLMSWLLLAGGLLGAGMSWVARQRRRRL